MRSIRQAAVCLAWKRVYAYAVPDSVWRQRAHGRAEAAAAHAPRRLAGAAIRSFRGQHAATATEKVAGQIAHGHPFRRGPQQGGVHVLYQTHTQPKRDVDNREPLAHRSQRTRTTPGLRAMSADPAPRNPSG